MIIKGNERSHGAELARHLLNPRDNEHVTVHAVEGFVADDLIGAFAEAEAISGGTACEKYLFSLSLNPPPNVAVSVEAFEDAIASIENRLGLIGQPRAIVFHEKMGRRHAHVVWSRIDAARMKAITLSHYKRKLMDISRELYRTHDWDMPDGFRDSEHRNPHNYRAEEAAQAKRAQTDPKALKAIFNRCWEQSDSRSAFAAALWEEGFLLARGDRRGFVAIDADGKVWSLSRWCGVKPKELRARLGSEDQLWSIEEARAAFNDFEPPTGKNQHQESDRDFERRRQALVETQRAERENFLASQKERWLAELRARHHRLPKGIRAVWAKLTGQYQSVVRELEQEALVAKRRDAHEFQALVDKHLAERTELDRVTARPDILDALNAVFEKAVQRDPRQRLILKADDIPLTESQLIAQPELICDHVSIKKERFTRVDILRALAERIRDPLVLKHAADRALAWQGLVKCNDASSTTHFTTKEYLASKQQLESCAADLANQSGFAVSTKHIDNAVFQQNKEMHARFGGRLSAEQSAAVRHVLGDRQLANVVGLAGAGKSTMLKTANAAWRAAGIKVHGAALAGKAADGLETASGIPSRTLASLELSWKNGYEPIEPGDVLVIDEAGMIGTRQLSRIADKLHNIGAKMVLVGDPDQLQPIEAGTPFKKIIEAHGAARLSEIHRQQTAWQKQASRDLADGDVKKAIESYATKGCVIQTETLDGALASLAEEYIRDIERKGASISRLAFAHSRQNVYDLNQAIRAGLRSIGNPQPETLFQTETGTRAFSQGDRIVFTRNDRDIGVKNGSLGTVKGISHQQIIVDLDTEDEHVHRIEFNPTQYTSFDHGYAVTIHKSQGATVDHAYVLASRSMDNPLTYVALTRHRKEMRLYNSAESEPRWMTSKRLRQNNQGPTRFGPSY